MHVISSARRSCIWVPCRYTSEKSEEGNARRHKRPFLYAARPAGRAGRAGRLSDKISVPGKPEGRSSFRSFLRESVFLEDLVVSKVLF